MKAPTVDPVLLKVFKKIPKLAFRGRLNLAIFRFVAGVAPRSSLKSKVKLTRAKGAPRNTIIVEPKTPVGSPRPAVMMIHGGGHIMGGPKNTLPTLALLATELDCTIISPSYRVAPENPFPADLDDCHAAWMWLQENTQSLNIDAERIALAGNSAGGGLAAALALRLRDEGAPQPVAQALVYPMLDDRTALKRELDGLHHLWYNEINLFAWESYLAPLAPGDENVTPYAAPARSEDLSGLPPAWLGVGDADLFYDEDLEYARRITEAGGSCTLTTIKGAPHGFDLVAAWSPQAKELNGSLVEFLQNQLQIKTAKAMSV